MRCYEFYVLSYLLFKELRSFCSRADRLVNFFRLTSGTYKLSGDGLDIDGRKLLFLSIDLSLLLKLMSIVSLLFFLRFMIWAAKSVGDACSAIDWSFLNYAPSDCPFYISWLSSMFIFAKWLSWKELGRLCCTNLDFLVSRESRWLDRDEFRGFFESLRLWLWVLSKAESLEYMIYFKAVISISMDLIFSYFSWIVLI